MSGSDSGVRQAENVDSGSRPRIFSAFLNSGASGDSTLSESAYELHSRTTAQQLEAVQFWWPCSKPGGGPNLGDALRFENAGASFRVGRHLVAGEECAMP